MCLCHELTVLLSHVLGSFMNEKVMMPSLPKLISAVLYDVCELIVALKNQPVCGLFNNFFFSLYNLPTFDYYFCLLRFVGSDVQTCIYHSCLSIKAHTFVAMWGKCYSQPALHFICVVYVEFIPK